MRRRRRGRYKYGSFVMLGRDMLLHCEEWKRFSSAAKLVYIYLKAKHNGSHSSAPHRAHSNGTGSARSTRAVSSNGHKSAPAVRAKRVIGKTGSKAGVSARGNRQRAVAAGNKSRNGKRLSFSGSSRQGTKKHR